MLRLGYNATFTNGDNTEMKFKSTLLLGMLLSLAVSVSAQQSISFTRTITIASNGFTANIALGVNGDGPGGAILDNTLGGDIDLMFGGEYSAPWSEEQAPPPPPPPFDLDVRLATPPGRTTAWPTGFGGGMYTDFRGFTASTQIDTFRIQIAGDSPENSGATISWPNDLAAVASSWQIKGQNAATPLPATDMLSATSATVDAQGGTLQVLIIVTNYNTGVSVERTGSSAEGFALNGNYPNPFNPSTTITYSIPARETVTLDIYNIYGALVSRLVNALQEQGTYSVQFNGNGLAGGVYYYRLQAGVFSGVRSMMLVK